MQLVEQGKLDLERPITTYLPDYRADTGARITTHHLLTHTSGIPNYTADPGFGEHSRDPYEPYEFARLFCSGDLEFEPGSDWNYSNSGYFLLGVIIEKVAGVSYEKQLQQRILAPLGMNDTGYDHHPTILERRVSGYSRVVDELRNAEYLDMGLPYAAGSIYSSVEDLFLWDQALYTEKLLPEAALERMFTPVKNDYGYGWAIREVTIGDGDRKLKTVGHGGGINGFNTLITRLVEDRSLIVLFSNAGRAPLNQIAEQILNILYDEPYELPEESLGRAVVRTLFGDGQDAAIARYRSAGEKADARAVERELNNQGYALLAVGQTAEALEALQLNVTLFPESANVHDSLGEALLAAGRRDDAIRSYAKSLELDPTNTNAIRKLSEIAEMPGPASADGAAD